MRLKIFVTITSILLVSVFLAACGGKSTNEESSSQVMKTEDIKTLVNDYSVGKIKDQSASITSEQLLVTDSDKKQYVYDLPEDEFFVSIAPYIDSTHP